jgi:hypothetical protein
MGNGFLFVNYAQKQHAMLTDKNLHVENPQEADFQRPALDGMDAVVIVL